MEITSIQKFIHTSPRKLRLVADMVRQMEPNKALDVLMFTPKYASKDLSLAIKTALANAKQSGLETKELIFKSLEINESTKMRRYRAGTRGRVKPYKKRMAHIRIVLSDQRVHSEGGEVINEKIGKENNDKKEEK